MQIADLISKLRAKIIAVVRGATFLINARSNARMGEEDGGWSGRGFRFYAPI